MNTIINKLICIKNNLTPNIIISEDKYKYLQIGSNPCESSVALIHVLLNEYYYNLINLFKSNSYNVEIFIKYIDDIVATPHETRVEFINKLETLSKKGIFNNDEIRKINYLKSLINYEFVIKNKTFIYYYEQQRKEITTEKVLNLFKQDNKIFIEKINNCNEEYKDELIVLLLSFSSKYLNKFGYIVSENIQKNVEYIVKISNDYDVIDKINLKKKPSYIKKAKLNQELIDNILKEIPLDFTDYEKSLYAYIYLCNHLTHDEEDINKINEKIDHKNINRIKSINEKNNIVVCYEFATIYALILDRLNIKYEMSGDPKYGRGHIYLSIVYKDSKICVEATKGLFECDLTRTKNNLKICGYIVEKSNPKTQEEIDKSYDKVYEYIEKKYNKKFFFEPDYIKYKRLEIQYENIDIEKKLHIFYDEINNCDLPPIDKVKYIRLLKKIMFGKNKDFDMCIILNNNKVSIVFSLKQNDDYKYYLYIYPNNIIETTKSQIEQGFNSGCFEYIEEFSDEIQGIKKKSKKKKNSIFD